MKKCLLIIFVFFISYSKSQILSEKEEKQISFLPVRTSFEDEIINAYSRSSFKEYAKVMEIDSLLYPTVIIFKGKFKNHLLDIYDMGEVDIFNFKKNIYKKYISFNNVTTNPTNNYTGNQVLLNSENKKNSFLVLLDKKNGLVLNNSCKYHFIYVYYNKEKRYWHVLYSNYLDTSS